MSPMNVRAGACVLHQTSVAGAAWTRSAGPRWACGQRIDAASDGAARWSAIRPYAAEAPPRPRGRFRGMERARPNATPPGGARDDRPEGSSREDAQNRACRGRHAVSFLGCGDIVLDAVGRARTQGRVARDTWDYVDRPSRPGGGASSNRTLSAGRPYPIGLDLRCAGPALIYQRRPWAARSSSLAALVASTVDRIPPPAARISM